MEDFLGALKVFQFEDMVNTPCGSVLVDSEKQIDPSSVEVSLVVGDMSEKLFF